MFEKQKYENIRERLNGFVTDIKLTKELLENSFKDGFSNNGYFRNIDMSNIVAFEDCELKVTKDMIAGDSSIKFRVTKLPVEIINPSQENSILSRGDIVYLDIPDTIGIYVKVFRYYIKNDKQVFAMAINKDLSIETISQVMSDNEDGMISYVDIFRSLSCLLLYKTMEVSYER